VGVVRAHPGVRRKAVGSGPRAGPDLRFEGPHALAGVGSREEESGLFEWRCVGVRGHRRVFWHLEGKVQAVRVKRRGPHGAVHYALRREVVEHLLVRCVDR
jgi:hypothetical protein